MEVGKWANLTTVGLSRGVRFHMKGDASRRRQIEVDAMNYKLNEKDILCSFSTLHGRMV